MDQSSKILLVLAFIMCSYAPLVTCRDLKNTPNRLKLFEENTSNTPNRLKLFEENTSTCWDSLFELQSCTGEIVLFFLNGETYLGPNCCSAVRTIQGHCWPSMLGSVGINDKESDVLLGYCDTGDSGSTPKPPQLPPPSHPSPPRFPIFHRH